jgi:alpha-beta hydrolase superfamily lysophospholipase
MKRTIQLCFLAVTIVCCALLAQSPERRRSSKTPSKVKASSAVEQHFVVDRGAGHDPHAWLGGWHADAMKAGNDIVAPRKFAGVLKAALGDCVTVVMIPNAGHALLEEQPQAMSEAIAAFARALQDPSGGAARIDLLDWPPLNLHFLDSFSPATQDA